MSTSERVTLARLQALKSTGRKFAMLTAYDFPTAAAAQAAGVQSLLIGDSMGTVLLGQPNTRGVPLELMITLGRAVRAAAPSVFLIGDLPYESLSRGPAVACDAARRFVQEAGCDAVKLETADDQADLVAALHAEKFCTIAHLGLRPQSIDTPDGYRAQARDAAAIAELVQSARRMVAAGASMLLLEAVPPEAARAVLAATSVPLVGCGAGPDCDGHVVVTQDMLGIGSAKVPRFVPLLASLGPQIEDAMRRYVAQIESGAYPAPQHCYGMRREPAATGGS